MNHIAVSDFSRTARILAALFLLGWQAPAKAQTEINLPARADTQSANGVSFKTGAFNTIGTDLSIGGGGIAGLQQVRTYASSNSSSLTSLTSAKGWMFSTRASVIRNVYKYAPDEIPPAPNLVPLIYTVLTGTGVSRFRGGNVGSTIPSSGYIPYAKNGESLSFTKIGTGDPSSGSYHTFIDSAGAVYVYPWSNKQLQSVTYPDGTKLDYSYSPNWMIISNRGYALLWESTSKVCVINMAETYVTSAMTICPVNAQSVSYSYGTTSVTIVSATNAAGQTTNYEYVGGTGANHLGCIKDPGQTVCKISNVYNVCLPLNVSTPADRTRDQVTSQTTGTGETYTYTYGTTDLCNGYSGYGVSAKIVAPGGATTKVGANSYGAVVSLTDPLNRQSVFSYVTEGGFQASGTVLASARHPEDDSTSLSRDTRGNVIEKRSKSKPTLPTADIVTTASYPATCTNRKTCNKPDYVIDAKGNRIDYT